MSVSALISQFSNASSSSTASPPRSPDITPRGSLGRRHYSASSVGSSRSESPASCGSLSPRLSGAQNRHLSIGNDSKPQPRLSSITEDRIRMFNARCQSDKESTDSGVLQSQSSKRAASRQLSAGSNEPRKELGSKVQARRQLSAGAERGRSPSPFRLPGMATAAGAAQFSEEVQETDIDDAIDSLQSNSPTLRELNLNNHTRADAEVISELLEALSGNTHLKKLSMANIRFSEDHAKMLADVLRTNTTLTVVNLESNRITRKGIAAIMKALAENKQTAVSELRLANQYYAGGAGAEADIAKHLEKITSIVRLGYNFTSPSLRTKIDGYMMRNTDLIRQKRASLTV